jgi:plastocyanin
MNRQHGKRWGLFAAAVPIALFASGCKQKPNAFAPSDDAPASNAARQPVDPKTAGSITGVVRFEGVPRRPRNINMASVPNCAKLHSTPAKTQDVVTGEDGTLENVVVYLRGDFAEYSFDIPQAPAALDQNGCMYMPHAIALMKGQHLRVTNSDQTTHNVNAAPRINGGWNQSQGAGSAAADEVFQHAEIGIPVKCNIHPWMKSYIAVFANPYFQVTGEDGTFKLENVPPGAYKLTAWHEVYGSKEQDVTVSASQQETANITFSDRDRP